MVTNNTTDGNMANNADGGHSALDRLNPPKADPALRISETNRTAGAPAPAASQGPALAPKVPDEKTVATVSLLKRLRLSQDFASQAPVEKIITMVPIRKPGKNEFFRTRPGAEWRYPTMMLISRGDQETEHYFVDPPIQAELDDNLRPVELVLCVAKGGGIFLWPIGLPDETGKWNQWHKSASEAAKVAEDRWIKIVADRSQNMYQPIGTKGTFPEPTWPPLTFEEILEKAVRDRMIDSADHPVVKRIQGLL